MPILLYDGVRKMQKIALVYYINKILESKCLNFLFIIKYLTLISIHEKN